MQASCCCCLIFSVEIADFFQQVFFFRVWGPRFPAKRKTSPRRIDIGSIRTNGAHVRHWQQAQACRSQRDTRWRCRVHQPKGPLAIQTRGVASLKKNAVGDDGKNQKNKKSRDAFLRGGRKNSANSQFKNRVTLATPWIKPVCVCVGSIG